MKLKLSGMNTFKKVIILLCCIMIGSVGLMSALAEDYLLTVDNTSIKLLKIYSLGEKIFVKTEFRNDGSEAVYMGHEYSVTVWQQGRECKEDYMNKSNVNSSERVKDGASVDVTEVYILWDIKSIVEINIRKSFFGGEEYEFSVYYNPATGEYGDKDEVSSVSTPTQKLSVSPTPVPVDLGKPVENVVRAEFTLIENGKTKKGLFTGEMIDGFPHGFGVFESGSLVYIGNWNQGKRMTGGMYKMENEYDFTEEKTGK